MFFFKSSSLIKFCSLAILVAMVNANPYTGDENGNPTVPSSAGTSPVIGSPSKTLTLDHFEKNFKNVKPELQEKYYAEVKKYGNGKVITAPNKITMHDEHAKPDQRKFATEQYHEVKPHKQAAKKAAQDYLTQSNGPDLPKKPKRMAAVQVAHM